MTTIPGTKFPKPFAVGALLALLAILFGFVLGGAFGAVEDSIKSTLNASGTAVLDSVYQGEAAKKDAVVQKSFSYLIRAHLHGGAIGNAALAAIAAMLLFTGRGLLAQGSSVAFGAGALLYSVFWLAAGFAAPGLGSTGAAKEAYNWLAIPGAGLSIVGAVGAIVVLIKDSLLGANK